MRGEKERRYIWRGKREERHKGEKREIEDTSIYLTNIGQSLGIKLPHFTHTHTQYWQEGRLSTPIINKSLQLEVAPMKFGRKS